MCKTLRLGRCAVLVRMHMRTRECEYADAEEGSANANAKAKRQRAAAECERRGAEWRERANEMELSGGGEQRESNMSETQPSRNESARWTSA